MIVRRLAGCNESIAKNSSGSKSVGECWGVLGRRACDGRAAALSCSSVALAVVVVVVVIMMVIMVMAIFIDTAAMPSAS